MWRLTLLAKKIGVPKALGITTEEWVKRIGGYVRQSLEERQDAVKELTAEGLSSRDIGEVLGIGKTTVLRDQRGLNGPNHKKSIEATEEESGPNGPKDSPPKPQTFNQVNDNIRHQRNW